MKCDGTLLLPLNLHLLFCLALAEDFTDRIVAVADSDILVAPLAVANLTLDTPPRAAYLGPGNENVLVVDRWASIPTQNRGVQMELVPDSVASRVLERIPIVIGAGVLVLALVTGCTQVDQEETAVQQGKVKGAVGTSIDRDVPIDEANREIRTTTESTNESTTRKAANAPLEGEKADTIKLLEN